MSSDTVRPQIAVIIPAYNEEKSIGLVIADIPSDWVQTIIVADNNSTDKTAENARNAGAIVLSATTQGYGAACLCGIAHLATLATLPDIVVFLDGDYSDYPQELPLVVEPILSQNMDMVIGSRALGKAERGAMTIQQRFGNWLATKMLRWFYGVTYTDLGPFRAIRYDKLLALGMIDQNYGWTVEMQIKAAKQKLNTCEVPVNYRVRIGYSKVSGTIKGTIMAGYKIITTLFKYR
jgi:glycosyltransferase involved in cell wall biosynthesis